MPHDLLSLLPLLLLGPQLLPLVLLMFVAEYAVRRRVLPQTTRAGLLATMRVYFAGSS